MVYKFKNINRLSFFAIVLVVTLVFSGAHSAEKLKFAKVPSSPIQLKSIELLKIIYANLDVELELVEMPGLRSLQMSNDGKLSGEAMRIWEAGITYKNLIRVPTPLLSFSAFYYTLDGKKNNNINNLKSIHRIGIQRGVIQAENAVKGRKGVFRANSMGELAHKFSNGAFDVVLAFGRILELEFKNQNLPGTLTKGMPLETVTVYHYLHKKHAHLVDRIDREIKRMHEDGSILKITTSLFIN